MDSSPNEYPGKLTRRPSPLEPNLIRSNLTGVASASISSMKSEDLGSRRSSVTGVTPAGSPLFTYTTSPCLSPVRAPSGRIYLVANGPATHLPGIDRRDVLMTPTGPYPVRTPMSTPADVPENNPALEFLRRNAGMLGGLGFTLPPVQSQEGDATSPTTAAILQLSKEVAAEIDDFDESASEATWSRRTSMELPQCFGPFCLSRATSVEAGVPPQSPQLVASVHYNFVPQVSPKAPPGGFTPKQPKPATAVFAPGSFMAPQPGTMSFVLHAHPPTAPPPAPSMPPPAPTFAPQPPASSSTLPPAPSMPPPAPSAPPPAPSAAPPPPPQVSPPPAPSAPPPPPPPPPPPRKPPPGADAAVRSAANNNSSQVQTAIPTALFQPYPRQPPPPPQHPPYPQGKPPA
mmetsp:Transcript_66771/g.159718  ORF Transcript_66771/g.159718 Transcript_66771/m.159718 type:complete len:402 (-) Transcript_66771:127-1332(-)